LTERKSSSPDSNGLCCVLVEGDRVPGGMQRYTVRDAVDILGLSEGAIRNRLSRGTLRSVKEGGVVYVLLPADTPRDIKRDAADIPGESDALISEMRARIASLERQLEVANERLERQLEEANERDRENRRLLAAALERIPAIEAPTEAVDETKGSEARSVHEQPQEPSSRPWWRRIFGA
jgi:hypothetical protein